MASLTEASRNSELCVLHSSKLGEPLYAKFGFECVGKINTYEVDV